ncbi:MAG: hypothetical protein R2706_09000 [Acidimicrobiales bacterium]
MRTIVGGKANPKAFRFDNDPRMARRGSSNKGKRGAQKQRGPNTFDTARTLNEHKMLPAIYFISADKRVMTPCNRCSNRGKPSRRPRSGTRFAFSRPSVRLRVKISVLGYPKMLAALE